MKLIIDDCTAITGWISSDSTKAVVYGINQIKDFIAEDLAGSLIIHWKANSLGSYVEKTVSKTVTGYEELIMSVFSQKLGSQLTDLQQLTDFNYSIKFDSGVEMGMPLYQYMTDVNFDIRGLSAITKIRITSLTNDEDYMILSNMVAIKEEIPLDVFIGIKAKLEEIRDLLVSYNIGKVTCLTGDKIVKPAYNDFLERYQVIKITDGTNTEYHQIDTTDESHFGFTGLYSGKTILHNYTNADVYIFIPVEYGQQEKEIILSGISISAIKHKEILRGSKLDSVRDSYYIAVESVNEMQDYAIVDWTIQIDCESRSQELLFMMAKIVDTFLNREYLWVNGKKFQIRYDSDPVHVDATEAFNQIPKIQYSMGIEVKENLYPKTRLANTDTITNNVYVR